MDIWNNYEEKRKISTGGYSSIYKVKNINTKQYVAIKEIDKNKCKINNGQSENKIKNNNTEIKRKWKWQRKYNWK